MLQETYIGRAHSLNFSNKRVFRDDKGIGTAVAIECKWKSERRWMKEKRAMQLTAIRAWIGNKELTIISIDVTCAAKKHELIQDLDELDDELRDTDQAIIGGDWNARHIDWSDQASNARGKALRLWLSENPSWTRISPEGQLRAEVTRELFEVELPTERNMTRSEIDSVIEIITNKIIKVMRSLSR